MKIICFIGNLNSGGAERQLVGLALMLKQIGHDVRVLTTHNENFYIYLLNNSKIPHEILKYGQNKIKRIYSMYNYIKSFKPNFIITYLPGPSMLSCLIKFLGLKFKLIVSERNTTMKLNLYERIKFFLYRFSDFIVCNSHSQKKFILKHYSNLRSKTFVITNFVDIDNFYPEKKNKAESDKINLLIIGRITNQKNTLRFLEALRICLDNDLKLSVKWFGNSSDKIYYLKCLKKIELLKLDSVFVFLEPIPNIAEEYRKADVFCLPSLYEGTPNVICEAMASGIPILCSDVCDNPHIVDDGRNAFLFDPFSEKSIAKAIIKFYNLSILKKIEMGRHSRFLAEKNLSKEKFLNSYLLLLQN